MRTNFSSYSQWSPLSATPNPSPRIDIENGVRDVLPRFRVHIRVLRSIRARISNEDDGGLLGTLGARSLLGDGMDLPSTLFADSFLPTRASALSASLDLPQRLLIPVVKCEKVPVPRAMRGGALRWKRLNNQSSSDLATMQLLQGAVALACVTGNSLALVLAFEAPPFTMWVTAPTDGPLVEDNSLSLALSAATSLRPGETMGLLARLNDDGRVVTAVHASERPNALAGAWSLGDFNMGRTAAASYVLRATSQQNNRIRRRPALNADDDTDTDARRDVVFFLAHYSSLRGGAPMLFRCTARVARESETYVATVRDEDADEDMDTLVADFETTSRIAADERQQGLPQEEEDISAPGSLERLVGKVDALRSALDTRDALGDVPGEEIIPDSTASASFGAIPLEINREGMGGEASKAPLGEKTVGYGNLPKAIRVDFESEDLRDWTSGRASSSKDDTAISKDAGDTYRSSLGMEENQSWRLVDRLARKYLGENYSGNTSDR